MYIVCHQSRKLRIHEDPVGGIYIPGVTMQKVESEDEVCVCVCVRIWESMRG